MMGLFIIMEFLLELNAREADCRTYQEGQSASLAFNSRKTSRNSNMKSTFKTYLIKDQIPFFILFFDQN